MLISLPICGHTTMLRFPSSVRSLTRRELTRSVHQTLPHLSYQQSKQLVDEVIEEILSALTNGEHVKLRGFGTFHVRDKRARIGRNPKTKEDAIITARRVATFKAAPKFVAIVNGRPYDDTADNDEE